MSLSGLVWIVVLGSLGLGYFVYGRRQRAVVPLLCGIALMLLPCFVHHSLWLLILGAGFAGLPWLYER